MMAAPFYNQSNMPYPHRIRLRGPWQFETLARYASAAQEGATAQGEPPGAGRTTVPSDWGDVLGADFRGVVRYARRFNPPASLDAHERLWLVVDGVDARGSVSLNGNQLGNVEGYAVQASFDITSLVAARNELQLDVELPVEASPGGAPLRPGRETMPGGPVGEVWLEVRSEWFIDRLAIWSVADSLPAFVAHGRLAGDAAGARLAVVISGCQRELAYIEATDGEDFEVSFQAGDFPKWTCLAPQLAPVEVKLLSGGASVWQTQIETSFRAAQTNDALTYLARILPEADYADFDRRGASIVQQVPLAWADKVCPRLAHHPAIVAWSVEAGEQLPAAATCGRSWCAAPMHGIPSDR
ncbi:MAG TPA: hypothetical protein VHC22_01390 [Pirellulales bacterium]|nr:hypothetical protein [Pirellulales bacterium]